MAIIYFDGPDGLALVSLLEYEAVQAELREARTQIAEAERGRLQFRKAYRELRAQIAAKDAALPVAYTSQLELRRIANGHMGRMQSDAGGDFSVPLFATPARETESVLP